MVFRFVVLGFVGMTMVLMAATFAVALVTLLRVGVVMAQVDDLNADVAALAQAVVDLQAEVAAVQPSAPVDLTGAISGVQSATQAVTDSTAALKAKFGG